MVFLWDVVVRIITIGISSVLHVVSLMHIELVLVDGVLIARQVKLENELLAYCEKVDVGVLARLALQKVIDLFNLSIIILKQLRKSISISRIIIHNFEQINEPQIVVTGLLEALSRVLCPISEDFSWLELCNFLNSCMSCLVRKRYSITSERREHFMNKEVFSVLFTLLHTLLKSVPSLEVFIIHVADFFSMVMLNNESMSARLHPVDVEVNFVIWVDFG